MSAGLTITRAKHQPTDGRHRTLIVQAGAGASQVPAAGMAGVLARLTLNVLPDLQGNATLHGCRWAPRVRRDEPDEIRSAISGDGCDVWLNDDTDTRADGAPPCLVLRIPRNREHAWTDRLAAELRDLAALDTNRPTDRRYTA